MRVLLTICLLSSFLPFLKGQEDLQEDALFIRQIYDETLTNGKAYQWLDHLSEQIGGRLAGSPQAAAAVEYTRQLMQLELGMDSVWLQPCMVPHWVRGDEEVVRIVGASYLGTQDLSALALGNSVGTPGEGITAQVIEVHTLDELEELGREKLEGKIVFFNRPMDPTQIRTFNAYGGAVDQRTQGAARAARYGAVAAVVRSMTTEIDDIPHTGVTLYEEGGNKIPALSISTADAELLSQALEREPIRLYLWANCRNYPPTLSYNVIGEIRGRTHPEEIILVGGHLDAWDVGGGAHDDGAGCMHALEVVRTLKALDYRPKRTLRAVMFMNEENGLAGALAYAQASNEAGEFHLAAIESDAGGFTPRGFSLDGDKEVLPGFSQRAAQWLPLLEPYGLSFRTGGSGADISRLKSQQGLLIGFRPDSQRYFDYHHTAEDRIEAVNPRELHLGAASIASLVYLIDKTGLR